MNIELLKKEKLIGDYQWREIETSDLFDNYRGSDLGVFKEFLRHVIGQSNTPMRGRIAREVAGVHADGFIEP